MPKEIQTITYCCNVCGYPYHSYNTAIMCEAAPIIPELNIQHVGDIIDFVAEDLMTPDRMVTNFETGHIMVKTYLTTKNQSGFFEHRIAYIVRCREDESCWEERLVFRAGDDPDNPGALVSPSRFRYKQGYHRNMPKHLRILEHIEYDQHVADA